MSLATCLLYISIYTYHNEPPHTHTSPPKNPKKLAGWPSPAEGKSERGELGDQGDLRQVTSEDCSSVILNPWPIEGFNEELFWSWINICLTGRMCLRTRWRTSWRSSGSRWTQSSATSSSSSPTRWWWWWLMWQAAIIARKKETTAERLHDTRSSLAAAEDEIRSLPSHSSSSPSSPSSSNSLSSSLSSQTSQSALYREKKQHVNSFAGETVLKGDDFKR